VTVFLFKLIVTPIFIGSVTLAGRRWGPAFSGLLMGLPLTSGPISIFLALQYGPAFAASTALLNRFSWTLLAASILLLTAIVVAYRLMPRQAFGAAPNRPPRWDLPARMLVATAFVLALTGLARSLGPQLSGLIAPFPVFGVVLAAFTQHRQGPAAAGLLRGNVLGSLAFIAFFLVTGWGLGHGTLAAIYLAAALASIGTGGVVFLASRSSAA